MSEDEQLQLAERLLVDEEAEEPSLDPGLGR